MTDKKPVGRPRTTLADIPENWEEIVIDAAQQGASDVELRCLLGISQAGFKTLLEDYDEFSITIKRAHDVCAVWWERLGRSMACGQTQGNPTMWIFNMKNRFGWNDKVDNSFQDSAFKSVVFNLQPVKPRSIDDFYDDEEVTGIKRTIVDVKNMTDKELEDELARYKI